MNDLRKIFPHASAAFLARNSGKIAVVERDPKNVGVAKVSLQKEAGGRFLVRVTSIRRRLLDEDNLCSKYFIDLCRYAGALPGDEPGTAKIETDQRKPKKGEAEKIIIEIFKLPVASEIGSHSDTGRPASASSQED